MSSEREWFDKVAPIDLKTKLFGKSNSWVIVGLPDTEEQFIDSLRRGGVGAQSSPQDYFDIVTFVERSYRMGMPCRVLDT